MKEFLKFLISKEFLKQLLYVVLFLILVVFAVLMWLKSYTNHGQQIKLDDYTNSDLQSAVDAAADQTFKIIVSDSTHIVGKPGGLILDQNPPAGSLVKEKRKIYVTTTKYEPDNILVKDLPLLYGTDFDQAVADLKGRYIYSEIKSRKQDPGQPNHILEVWYGDQKIIDRNSVKNKVKIEKGGTLSFVISDQNGGSFIIPDLTCRQYADVKSYMLYSKLRIGNIKDDGTVENREEAWVSTQFPRGDGVSKLNAGSSIDITLSSKRPINCN